MAKFKNLILTEIGNTTDGYDYYLVKDENKVSASFKTRENNYVVEILKRDSDSWALVDFGVGPGMDASPTDEGVQFKVIATIMNIVKEVWEKRNKFFDGTIKGFSFFSTAKPDEDLGNTSRDRLYKKFIKKQFPNAKIKKAGESYKIMPASSNTK